MDIIPQKRCTKCLQEFPATLTYFHTEKSVKDGLRSKCKECSNASRRKHPRSEPVPDGYRRCPQCKEIKPLTSEYFVPNRTKVGYFYTPCKACSAEKLRVYRQSHRQEAKQYNEEYRQLHLERIKQKKQEHHRTHIEQVRQYSKRYRESHLEQRSAIERNRRAHKRAVKGSHTREDIQAQFKRQKGRCYWCGDKLTKYHVDHVVPLSREGSSNDPSNLVIACPTCNIGRKNRLPHEWPKGGRLL